MRYPIEILAMLTPEGFDDRFHEHCKSSKTYFEAYEKTEKEFEMYYAKRNYSSYDSFRISHNKRIKNYKKR
jgi:hypothetical protein|tara:strand:- start:10211 stop:10423 length:213 start_codon:yes stop_codon:yes gene_type:complete